VLSTNLCREEKWNLDREGGEAYISNTKTILPNQNQNEDQDGVAETRRTIIPIHLWDWMIQIQAKFNGEVMLN
jgi:hypothetical protein